VIIGVRELIEKYQREKTVESAAINVKPLEQPPVTPEPAKPTDGVAASVAPTTPSEGAPAAPPAPAPAATAEPPAPAKPAQNEIVASPPPSPAVTLAAPKVEEAKAAPPAPPKPETAAKKEETPAAPTTAPASVDSAAAKKTKNEIILEALDKVDVKFQIKGETKRVSLGPTQVHTIHADQPITLDVSDGGAVNIILNGRERGVPGDLGKPKTIKIP
jgi:cytoskeleton protein RodZ